MGSCCSHQEDCGPQDGMGNTNDSEPLAPVDLPPGWKAVPSRSRPGQVAYQNIHTGERISWIPTEEAKTYKGGISKRKKKKTPKNPNETDGSQTSLVNGDAAKKAANMSESSDKETSALAAT